MKKLILIFLLITHSILKSGAQTTDSLALIDEKMLAIPDNLTRNTSDIAGFINQNFTSQAQKARAIFIWTASNIRYDVANMYNVNFFEKPEDKINHALKTHRGTCSNYAAVFNDLCSKTGIKSIIVEGYTQQKGVADMPHAWMALLIDGKWQLSDPTWGAGYVSHERFFAKINNTYYLISPAEMIKSHMPFDPLWQFLEHPVSYQHFDNRNFEGNQTTYFSYSDSIRNYEKQSELQQFIATSRRMEQNGLSNSMVSDRKRHIKEAITIIIQNRLIIIYNTAVEDGNEGVRLFNLYIDYWNRQFHPLKPDSVIGRMLFTSEKKLVHAHRLLLTIHGANDQLQESIEKFSRIVDHSLSEVQIQKEWLNTYFSKDKAGRKRMFYK